jgi:N-formylglutamate amidohydrolase
MPPRDRTNRLLADIILGDCLDITLDRDKAKSITEFFNGEGLRVVWNDPYAGGYITRAHGKAGTPRQAVQIEINRALYMRDKAMAAGTPKLDISKARQITRLMGRFGAYLVKMQTAAA